jgi:hypothetical protein
MLLPFFPSVALAGLVVAHLPRSDDVGTISCTPLSGASGTLEIVGITPVWQRQLAIIDGTLQQDTKNENQQFTFENCTSTFMNETALISMTIPFTMGASFGIARVCIDIRWQTYHAYRRLFFMSFQSRSTKYKPLLLVQPIHHC